MDNIRTRPVTAEYEQGYERAFAGTETLATPSRKPGRTVYVYDPEAGLVEVGSDWQPTARRVPVVGDAHYDGMRATDGTDISSRTKHRNYMKANGLALAGDFTETWAKAAAERTAPTVKDPARREAIGQTIYELEKRRHA